MPATPGTWAWPPSFPSVPTSRATRVTSPAKPFSWSTMVLIVSLSCRISPRTSTVIFLERSPRATAVVTSAMLRTWSVRLPHIAFTESVRSFQVPATPGTIAWPPSLPSVPTSRATRVTSEAKERSWSTIVLMASLSCRISPRTSTVILRDRSPLATAIVTSAMLRTWAVRLLAIELTLSVSSRHTPVTSLTLAWPPSLPSVPTSRATRVTSEVKTESCLIIVLTMVAARRNSPFSGRPSTSRRTVCSRSPWATAPITRVTSVVGQTRSSISVLTDPSISPQAPADRPNFTRWRVRPCSPTALPMRSSWWAMLSFPAAMSFTTEAILPRVPSGSPVSRTEKLPPRRASSTFSSSCRSVADGTRREPEVVVGPLAKEEPASAVMQKAPSSGSTARGFISVRSEPSPGAVGPPATGNNVDGCARLHALLRLS